jgi:polysaccharide biosynthesis/export protein
MKLLPVVILFLYVSLFYSCRAYRANIILQTDSSTYRTSLMAGKQQAENNYKIEIDDRLKLKVYTNEGERIIDPDYELVRQNINQDAYREEKEYLVEVDGQVKFPMVGMVHLEGLTLKEAETVLQKLYSKFYKDPFVSLEFTNKRVVVLGATGGQVIPLNNENMNLLEVLALAGGLNDRAKGYNIRLIRGDLNNPEVQIIDLSTIEGMKKAALQVYPGDIIYVEPVRKIFTESLTDILPFISLIISMATLALLIKSL